MTQGEPGQLAFRLWRKALWEKLWTQVSELGDLGSNPSSIPYEQHKS